MSAQKQKLMFGLTNSQTNNQRQNGQNFLVFCRRQQRCQPLSWSPQQQRGFNMNHYILRKPEVLTKTGLPRSTFHSRINAGLMPPPIPLGARAVGFLSTEIDAVLNAMIAGKTQEQIKELVASLVKNRQQIGGLK